MDRVAPGIARDLQDLRAVEIGRSSGSGKRAGFIAAPDVQRGGVVFREDRNARDVLLGGGTRDADRDLCAIGYQQPVHAAHFNMR